MMRYTNTYSYSTPNPHTYLKNPVSNGFIGLGTNDVVTLEHIKNSALE